MEENVRIVVTGDNRDALKKLNKVEDAVNRLNSATKKVEVKVNGIQEAERQAARLYETLERIENAALSKLPRSVQLVIAYLKAASQSAQELGGRLAFAGTVVDNLQRAKFIPAGLLAAGKEVKTLNRDLLITLDMFQRISAEFSNLRSKALPRAGGSQGFTGFLTQQYPAMPPGFGAGPPQLPPSYGPGFGPGNDRAPVKTLERLEAQRRVLESVYRTIEIGTPRYKQLGEDIAQLTQEIQDAQLRFQKVTTKATPGSIAALREEVAAKEAAFNQTKRGTREFNELADELRRLNTELSKTERFIEGRTKGRGGRVGTALQSAALGGGFPLLFGGPSFSAAGGALGGFAGGLVGQGAGFAGGIVGSALGSAVDTFVEKAKDLGRALRDPTENIDALVDVLGTTGAATRGLITQLKALGLEEVAAATATELLNAELATLGVDADKFKDETAELDNAVKDLQLVFTALATQLVPILNKITQIVSGFVGTNVKTGTASASGFSAADAVQGSVDATLAVKRAEEARNEILNRNILLERQITFIKQQSNKITASQRADLQFFVNLQKNSLELVKLQLRFDNERNEAKKKLLKNEILITLEKRKQIAADRDAAAERSIADRVAKLNEAQAREGLIKAQTAQIARRSNNLDLSSIQRIPGEITSVIETANAEIDVLEAKIQNIRADNTLLAQDQKAQAAILEAQINKIKAQKNLQVRQLELTEDRLNAERELANLVTSNQQKLQLAQAGGATKRARLQLANPFGGDEYERAIQNLDQLNERQALRVQQEQQIAALKAQKTQDGADVALLDTQIRQQELVNEQLRNELLNRQALERKILRQEQALEKVQPVVSALQTGFTELFTSVIDGSKSTQEVLADMFGNIAEAFASMAAKIIAEQLVMIALQGILRALGAVSAAAAPVPKDGAAFQGIGTSTLDSLGGAGPISDPKGLFTPPTLVSGKATGGPVANNVPYLVGEEGPELFVPFQNGTIVPNGQTQQMMSGASQGGGNSNTVNNSFQQMMNNASQNGGNSSTVNNSFQQMQVTNVPFTRSAEQASVIAAEQETAKAIRNPGPIDVRYESQVINGVEYVTAEQHQKGMAQAADRGRALTLASLQNSVKARRRIGL